MRLIVSPVCCANSLETPISSHRNRSVIKVKAGEMNFTSSIWSQGATLKIDWNYAQTIRVLPVRSSCIMAKAPANQAQAACACPLRGR
jgi:hypothetical protein